MKKILYISNIAGKLGIDSFSIAAVNAAKECGLEFHTAINYSSVDSEVMRRDQEKYGVHLHHIDFHRNPFSPYNYKAYRQVVDLIKNEQIDSIHCNTPIGGLIGRLAGMKRKLKPIIYQAHGFHFYSGAPILNWILYYPVERILAHFTDAIITINQEDYMRAQKFHLRNNGKVYYVPGVGIDTALYRPKEETRNNKRSELGFSDHDIIVISAGDLIERKNYRTAIQCIAKTSDKKIHYLICGQGPKLEELESLTKDLGVQERVHFLGFRSDMKEIMQASDIFLFTTLQEGLPRSMMEAMASGLPCVASRVRGNTDLLVDGKNGFLVDVRDDSGFAEKIESLAANASLRRSMGLANIQRMNEFDFSAAKTRIFEIYKREIVE